MDIVEKIGLGINPLERKVGVSLGDLGEKLKKSFSVRI